MVTHVRTLRANPNMVDPDVKVPDAVRRASEAASQAQAAAYPKDPNAPTPPVNPNAPPPAPDDTIKIEQTPPAQLPSEVTPPVVTTQPLTTPPAEPQPPVAPVPEESWEQRYHAMHGRWKKINDLNINLANRIEALENMLATSSAAPSREQLDTPVEKLLTPQDEETFGPEMLDLMRRAAREVGGELLAPLAKQARTIEDKLTGTTATITQNAKQAMHRGLDEALPEWHDINVAPEFHAWLALPDPYSGVIRKRLLSEAYEQNKTPQVLAFFKGFVSELAATTPMEQLPGTPAATPQTPKPKLGDFTAPGRARTAAVSQTPAEKQIIYTSDINAFYDAKRKGLYNGREAEFAAAERELQLAMAEGRVRTNT